VASQDAFPEAGGPTEMWEDVNEDILKKVIQLERNEAQKKFWALSLLWIIILMIWLASTKSQGTESTLSPNIVTASYLLLVLLLGLIVLVTVYEYSRRIRPIRGAKYMFISTCEGRERLVSQGSGNLFQGYFITFRKPDKKISGWVQTSADFYANCTIGTPVLIISADQTEISKMRAFDPATFEL
jgi:hypothetical protein